MLQSLSQVGTNCHKVQNVLVSWGVCSLLTMPQPPWGGESSRSRCETTRERVELFWGWLFHAHRPTHRAGNTLYTAQAHNFVNSILLENIHVLKTQESVGWEGSWQREEEAAGPDRLAFWFQVCHLFAGPGH